MMVSKKTMLIVVVITLAIGGVFLFFATFFTIYTEHKDFYVTFHCTTKTNEPLQHVVIKHVDFIDDKRIYQTDSTGKTNPVLIRSEAIKNLFTTKRPSIFYFNPLFQFPGVDSNFYRIKFFTEKEFHQVILYTKQQDVIMERGKVIQKIPAKVTNKIPATSNSQVFVQNIFIEEDEIKINVSVESNKQN
jgi:hypothetical protein